MEENKNNVVGLTPEQFDALAARITVKPEDIAAAVKNAMPPAPEPKIEVVGERKPNYIPRAVAYMSYMHAVQNRETSAAEKARARLLTLNGEVTDSMLAAEDKEARNILTQGGLKPNRIETYMRAMSTLTDSAGGFTIPKPIFAQIFVTMDDYGIARRFGNVFNMTSKTLDLASIATAPTVGWVGELARKPESDGVFARRILTAYKLAGVMSWSDELEEDQIVELLPTWLELLAINAASKEDQAFLLGDGTATYGNHTGIRGIVTVGNTVTSALTTANLLNVRNKVKTSEQRNARWFMHPTIEQAILTEQAGLDAKNLAPVIVDNQRGRIASIWGFPVELSDLMPTAGAGNTLVLFGNPNNVMVGIRKPFEFVTSREGVISDAAGVVTFNALTQNGTILVAEESVALGVPNAFVNGFARLVQS